MHWLAVVILGSILVAEAVQLPGQRVDLGEPPIPIPCGPSTWRSGNTRNTKHANNVCSIGDEFAAPAFTPAGTPLPSALSLIRQLAHTGDKIDSSIGRDAQRFHHECTSATFLTPTHTAHTSTCAQQV